MNRPTNLFCLLLGTLLVLAFAEHAQAEESDQSAVVHVRTTRPGITISSVTGRVAVSSGYSSAVGVGWEDICKAPCTFKTKPGLVELVVTRAAPGNPAQVDLSPGDNYFIAKPGSKLGYYGGYTLATLGVLAATWGGVVLLADGSSASSWSFLLGGLGGTAGGYILMKNSLSAIALEERPGLELEKRVLTFGGKF